MDNSQRILSELNWKIVGFAGQGIKGSGEMFSKMMSRMGYDVFDYTEYPSLIKGGHNTYEVYANKDKAYCQAKKADILISLNKNGLVFQKDDLTENSIVLCDLKDEKIDISTMGLKGKVIDIPWFSMVTEVGAERMMANNAALGATIALLDISFDSLVELIREEFGHKDPKIVEMNVNAARVGFDFVSKLGSKLGKVEAIAGKQTKALAGNEAIGLGAIAGGIQFYAAYPMSPSTSLLHYLSSKGPKMGIMVKHAEDEIGVINMALGASFAGARSMVGTSGGGFCYMVEALGFSGVAELPLVVMLAMRPGPALGMPTWTSQADVLFTIFSSHDEFPKIVLAPGDTQEAFEMTKLALELAEKYQTLVVLLSDKDLSEGRGTITLNQTKYENIRHGFLTDPKLAETGLFPRYYPTPGGVSFRTIPGVSGGNHLTNSYEHDEYGLATEEGVHRVVQMDKRMKKMDLIKREITKQTEVSEFGAQAGLIGFGTNKGVLLKARDNLAKQGVKVNVLNLNWLWPFPDDIVLKFLELNPLSVVVENNATGQLASLITMRLGKKVPLRLNKYDGRPFYSDEIEEFIKQQINNGSESTR
jgi:2-oxoglutarate/2-oxoacid ferredoxin oxidoreductase subunit alpha